MARQRLSRNPSVDRGYAFVVLASCFVIRMLVDSFWSSLGVLFLRWQADFDVSASSIAWIGSVFTLILMSTGKKQTILFLMACVIYGYIL